MGQSVLSRGAELTDCGGTGDLKSTGPCGTARRRGVGNECWELSSGLSGRKKESPITSDPGPAQSGGVGQVDELINTAIDQSVRLVHTPIELGKRPITRRLSVCLFASSSAKNTFSSKLLNVFAMRGTPISTTHLPAFSFKRNITTINHTSKYH